MSENKEPLIKTAAEEESKKTPPVAHEGGSPLKAEKPEGEQASVPAAETERLVPPPEDKTEGEKEQNPEDKEKSESEENNPFVGVSTKALARELVNRIVTYMRQ